MRFVSFFSGGFITAIVVNPLQRKLAKRISVQCMIVHQYRGRNLDGLSLSLYIKDKNSKIDFSIFLGATAPSQSFFPSQLSRVP